MEIELDVVLGGLFLIALFVALMVKCFRSDHD